MIVPFKGRTSKRNESYECSNEIRKLIYIDKVLIVDYLAHPTKFNSHLIISSSHQKHFVN